jgi:hypothetical protein
MIANVLRRLISLDISVSVTDEILERVHIILYTDCKIRAAGGGSMGTSRRAKPWATA